MIGDIAIAVLIFIAGFYTGKKYDTLGAFWNAAATKVKGWVKAAESQTPPAP